MIIAGGGAIYSVAGNIKIGQLERGFQWPNLCRQGGSLDYNEPQEFRSLAGVTGTPGAIRKLQKKPTSELG